MKVTTIFLLIVLTILCYFVYESRTNETTSKSCTYCGEEFSYGNCNGRTCQCKAGNTGPDCMFSNYSHSDLKGFTFLDTLPSTMHNYVAVGYAHFASPPYEDCEGMRITLRATGPDGIPDSGDEYVLADYTAELKLLGADQLDPYCLPFTRDRYISSCQMCLSVLNGRVTGDDDDPHYRGNLVATFSCVGSQRFELGEFDYTPPDRCSQTGCDIDFDDDLSTYQWTSVSITSASRPFIAINQIARDAGRLVFRFQDLPPPSLTLTYALQCQPTAQYHYEVDEKYDQKDWVLFDSCGLVISDTTAYFAFHCASPPCHFKVATIISYIQDIAPGDSLGVVGNEVQLYRSTAPMVNIYNRTAYSFVVDAIYPDSVSNWPMTADAPWINIRTRPFYCPLPNAPANASFPTSRLSTTETLTSIPKAGSEFRANTNYYFRVEIPKEPCANPIYDRDCKNVVYTVSLVPRAYTPPSYSSSPSKSSKPSKSHAFVYVFVSLFVIAIAAAAVFGVIWYRRKMASSPQAQGFQFFPSNTDFLEESEVDEVVVAEETPESNNAFRLTDNSFSL